MFSEINKKYNQNAKECIARLLSILFCAFAIFSDSCSYLGDTNSSNSNFSPATGTPSKVIRENLYIPFAGNVGIAGSYPKLSIELVDIEIFLTQSDVVFNFMLSNKGADNCNGIYFNTIELSDLYGKILQGQGGALDEYTINVNQSTPVRTDFNLDPVTGENYSLTLIEEVSGCVGEPNNLNAYQTESFVL